MDTDVVAIGGGLAGLIVANRCAELGLRALVLERETDARHACNSRYTTGIAHILFQDMRLPADRLLPVIERETAGCAKPALARALAENSRRAIDWLTREGARFMEINAPTGRSIIIAPPRRFKEGLDWEGRGGDVLLRRLEENLVKRGGRVLRGAHARELALANGACAGVDAEIEGKATRIAARAVVIADGGFGGSVEMIRRHVSPHADRLLLRGATTATGDGLRMAEAAGARLEGFGLFYGHPVHRDAITRGKADLWPFPFIDGLAQAGIVVGADGRRFADEGRGGIALANDMAQLDDPLSTTLVFDEAIWTTIGKEGPVAGNPMITSTGATLHKAGDLVTLARLAQLPTDALAQTVEAYNAAIAANSPATLTPPRTVRPFAAHPIARAPFYAVPLCCGVTATMGGIAIDEHCHALRSDGAVIAGLYAAGSTIAGIEGGPNVAYMGGLSKAFVFGLLAGEAIAGDAGKPVVR